MTKVVVEIPGQEPYAIRVGEGALSTLAQEVATLTSSDRAFLITDSNVADLYLESVRNLLRESGIAVSSVCLDPGEEAKSIECAGEIWDAMAECKLDRHSVVIALGGGVIGDLAGFCASTFMRGIRVIQVPTTLLAMVDSSVGGKTAINLDAGKNLVGTFHQPSYVCADTSLLASLPEREWICGCGEIAKTSVIADDEFFFWLSDNASALAARDAAITEEAVCRSVLFKAQVVARDARETQGVRECLNYGHTLAHAIEKNAGYGIYSHGHAVSQGMRFAARLSAAVAGLPLDFVAAQDALLDELGFEQIACPGEPEAMLAAMKSDKKNRGGQIRFVLLRDVGDWFVQALPDDLILEHLLAWKASV